MRPRILDVVESPADLKVLDEEELTILAQEIRGQIIATTSHMGGHVASSLGAVEIILAVHSLLDAPHDKLIFDVGHQAYAHKLVTGRLDRFDTLRSYQGISGFPNPFESEYDMHFSGHAADSLSVASGFAEARVLDGGDEKIVTVIGDAAVSGGMAFEALNYIGQEQLPLVIILNDNEMSISRNVGALMKHFGNIRTTPQYRSAREALQERLESGGAAGRAVARLGKSARDSIKQLVIPQSMMFENLGIVCTAPIDGHNIHDLRETLSLALAMDAPILMHVVTKKGAGYGPALRDPERFHGIGSYDIVTGAPMATSDTASISYTTAFGNALVDEAYDDEDIVAITAAMMGGTGLKPFARMFPERFIDVGIAEEHAVGEAAGLASNGKKPVVAIYSTFLQRSLDQMIIDVALPNLNVVFAIDRAGVVGSDGATHHGLFDISYLRMIPHMHILVPSDESELACALHTALSIDGPVAIRFPRGAGEGAVVPDHPDLLEVGRARVVREGADAAVLAFGRMVGRAVAAAEILADEGIDVRVVDMRWAKPLDEDAIAEAAQTGLVATVEEGVKYGGAGEGVLAVLASIGSQTAACVLGVGDTFVEQGDTDLLLHDLGLDAEGIAQSVREGLTKAQAS